MGELKGIDGLKNQVQECIQFAYDKGVKAGRREFLETKFSDEKQKWIEQGREEAWEVIRNLVFDVSIGGYTRNERLLIFNLDSISMIIGENTASEAIEKIKAWEEKKAVNDKLRVGDEIVNGTLKAVVIRIYDDGDFCVLNEDFTTGTFPQKCANKIKRTGRYFPRIAEVLEKMKNGE